MRSFGALVVQLDQQVVRELALNAEIPVLHVRRSRVARHCVLVLRHDLGGVERGEELVCPLQGLADVQAREIVGDRERPASTRRAPLPGKVRVVEDPVGGTDHRLVEKPVGEAEARSEIQKPRIGDLRTHIRRLPGHRVARSPHELAGDHVEAAQTAADMVRPLVVLIAQAGIEGKLRRHLDIVLDVGVI